MMNSLLATALLAAAPAWTQGRMQLSPSVRIQTSAPAVLSAAAAVRLVNSPALTLTPAALSAPTLQSVPVRAAPSLAVPTLQSVPVLAAPVPVMAPVAAAQTEVEVKPLASAVPVQAKLAQLSSRLQEVQSVGGDLGAGLAQAFDGAAQKTEAVHARPADDVVQARRMLKKRLKALSSLERRLTPAEAQDVLREAMELGLEVRAKASDLAAADNHWVGGPHIHVAGIHVPVEPGCQPLP